jgi:ABC-type Co2+ transport system permease subunit
MKKAKKVPMALTSQDQIKRGIPVSGIWGVAILFVCVSIGYANYVVFFGTEGLTAKLMLIPSTLFVGAFLVFKALR